MDGWSITIPYLTSTLKKAGLIRLAKMGFYRTKKESVLPHINFGHTIIRVQGSGETYLTPGPSKSK